MAKIVLGMGTSHGPMLSTPPDKWDLRVPADLKMRHHHQGKTWSFDELVLTRGAEQLAQQITPEVWRARHFQCRTALSEMARVFAEVKPDVAVIVGNDQMEVFNEDLIPAFSVMWGDTIINSEYSAERMASLPPGVGISVPGHIPSGGASHAGVPRLGEHVIRAMVADGFDITSLKRLPGDETPHAFGFIFRQLMNDHVIPTLPVLVNTFYPPNQPTAARCLAFGQSLAQAIESWDSDARVAVIASGGLSHFVIDEALDQRFLAAIRDSDMTSVAGMDESLFQAGTSELKNWIPVAAAMSSLDMKPTVVDYVPCYRSLAGTGNAMAFVHWRA